MNSCIQSILHSRLVGRRFDFNIGLADDEDMSFSYESLTKRNLGYVDLDLQKKIAETRVLIAGCGIGSQVAEAAARLGFQRFILVDGDTVDAHNLNRQSFFADQIGKTKVQALRENILRINPEADVEMIFRLVTSDNARSVVEKADLIFDTIDFLDLKAIVALHDEAHRQKKILVSSFSVGFGAAVISFSPNTHDHAWIREIFDLPHQGDIGTVSYVERFVKLFTTLAPGLDPAVVVAMQTVFRELADGRACPAPQVSPGAHAVAAICTTAALRLLKGEAVTPGPEMVVMNLSSIVQSPGFKLA